MPNKHLKMKATSESNRGTDSPQLLPVNDTSMATYVEQIIHSQLVQSESSTEMEGCYEMSKEAGTMLKEQEFPLDCSLKMLNSQTSDLLRTTKTNHSPTPQPPIFDFSSYMTNLQALGVCRTPENVFSFSFPPNYLRSFQPSLYNCTYQTDIRPSDHHQHKFPYPKPESLKMRYRKSSAPSTVQSFKMLEPRQQKSPLSHKHLELANSLERPPQVIYLSSSENNSVRPNLPSIIDLSSSGAESANTKPGSSRVAPGQFYILPTNNEEQRRGIKRPRNTPEEVKDAAYWDRRDKNNAAAKRSRDARRVKENKLADRLQYLESEHMKLTVELNLLRQLVDQLQQELYEL